MRGDTLVPAACYPPAPMRPDFDLTWPLHTWTHPDGRAYEARVDRWVLVRTAIDASGRREEQQQTCEDSDQAERMLEKLWYELRAQGFTETTPPHDPMRSFERCLANWAAEDPSFDAAALAEAQRAKAGPTLPEIFARLEQVATHMLATPQGFVSAFEPLEQQRARTWLVQHRAQIIPSLLLALRFGSSSVETTADGLLWEQPTPAMLPALLSVALHPAPHTGGGRHHPTDTLRKLGKPPTTTIGALVAGLGGPRGGVSWICRELLLHHAKDGALLAKVWPLRDANRDAEELVVRCLEKHPEPMGYDWLSKLRKRWKKKVDRERLDALLSRYDAAQGA